VTANQDYQKLTGAARELVCGQVASAIKGAQEMIAQTNAIQDELAKMKGSTDSVNGLTTGNLCGSTNKKECREGQQAGVQALEQQAQDCQKLTGAARELVCGQVLMR
jgi:hypothetical protein